VTAAMLASVLAASLLGLVVIFQFLLALALPFGRAAWGGTHRVLPPRLRFFSALSVLPLGMAAWIVLARTGVVGSPWQPATVRAATWIAFCVLALNTIANLASRSRVERLIMTPAAFVCSVCLLIAALSKYQ
jgi:hypothetical protein